jgi:hypothetical protein
MGDKKVSNINVYINYCISNVAKIPDVEKKLIVLSILDSDITQEQKEDAIPGLSKKSSGDGIRIFMNKLPHDIIMDIYKKISNCLKYYV